MKPASGLTTGDDIEQAARRPSLAVPWASARGDEQAWKTRAFEDAALGLSMCRRIGSIELPAGQVWAVGTMGLLGFRPSLPQDKVEHLDFSNLRCGICPPELGHQIVSAFRG